MSSGLVTSNLKTAASASTVAKVGSWSAAAAFVTWFGMGLESILRPFQDNRREAFWPVPFVFTMVAFTCVHLLHRGRRPGRHRLGIVSAG